MEPLYFVAEPSRAARSFNSLVYPILSQNEPETGETISSATLIVTAANDFTRPIHDRMPVLLEQHDLDAWLCSVSRLVCG
ncbi:MAG: SOS response-associated peptidase family protein [Methylocella sp.]